MRQTERFTQWLAARDRTVVVMVALTLVGFCARWMLGVGFMLGDDISYTDLIRDVLDGHWMQVEAIGQYSYRPMWVYPLAASIKLFGWSQRSLVLYPILTGSLIPLLMALWIRRHLPRGSIAPALCFAILACYPTLFVDSLVLSNETPMIFWCLACVNLFGLAFAQLAQSSQVTSRPWRLGGWSILAGTAFAAAYQVKSAAIPVLGLWLSADLLLHIRRHGWPKWGPLGLAAGAFVIPTLGVQYFYYTKTGHFLGNFQGELHFYDLDLPPDYFAGKYDVATIMGQYPLQLFQLDGYEGYQILLHGIWTWAGAGLVVLAFLAWKMIPREERILTVALVVVTVGLYLFLQYWPARLKPYYMPNCFAGRPWRYMDVIGPTTGAVIAILLTLPGLSDRRVFQGLRFVVLAAGFIVAGYGIAVRCFEFHDRASEFRRVGEDKAILAPYQDVPHFIDVDGYGALRAALGMPKHPELIGRGSGAKVILDFRHYPGGCVWTGGARRYGVNSDDAWAPTQVQALGGQLRLVHTWQSDERPWRINSLQLWAFEPNPPTIHDHPPPH